MLSLSVTSPSVTRISLVDDSLAAALQVDSHIRTHSPKLSSSHDMDDDIIIHRRDNGSDEVLPPSHWRAQHVHRFLLPLSWLQS